LVEVFGRNLGADDAGVHDCSFLLRTDFGLDSC